MNDRYRDVHAHGRTKKVRKAGSVIRVKADPQDMIAIEIPEWRIVDDASGSP